MTTRRRCPATILLNKIESIITGPFAFSRYSSVSPTSSLTTWLRVRWTGTIAGALFGRVTWFSQRYCGLPGLP